MSFDLNTCKWVMWGAKNRRNTYGHIQEAFLRAAKFMGKDAHWLDVGDNLSNFDFSNTLFMTMNTVVSGMPQREDCFYVVHNGFDPGSFSYFNNLKFLVFGLHISTNSYGNVIEIAPDTFFSPMSRSLAFRWGTDLLPHEIEANKPQRLFNSDSRIINYVGTIDASNREQIDGFIRACSENGIRFEHFGGVGGAPRVSIENNVRLIKESYMAPTLQRMDQISSGYIPCRLFKNISYGQFGISHSKYANDLFGGKLIYNPDTYRLFYEARERLQTTSIADLHALMDEVAKKHTYVNKINAIIQAINFLEGGAR